MKSEISETLTAFLATLGFLFVLLPILYIGIPYKIVSALNHKHLFDIGSFRYIGWAFIAVGVFIIFWCSFSFVFSGKGTPIHSMPPKRLVVKGLYQYVRNPMYIGGLLVLAGELLLFQSRDLLIYFLVIFVIFLVFVPIAEEPILSNRFGEGYKRYCKAVSRWIPHLTPYRENNSESPKR